MRRPHPPSTGSRALARTASVVLCAAAVTLTGCKRPGQSAEAIATAPSLDEFNGQAKCGVKKSSDKPLVIEWPAAERAALEARATRGLVAVRYSGCEMEVLTTCTARGEYEYLGLTQKTEGVRITNTDQLYAKLPIGAAGLEAKLERAGQLNVDMTIVGRRDATESSFNERDLEGRCDEATHVVTGLTVGSFSFYTGKSAVVGAGATVGNVGAGVSSTTDQQVLKTDGDVAACVSSTTTDEQPPEGCGALLRVEVVPIDRVFVNPSTPTPGGSASTTDDGVPVDDDQLQRQLTTARTMTFVGYGGAVIGLGMAGAGYFLYTRNKTKLEAESGFNATTVSPDRAQYNSRARLGAGLGWGGLGLAVIGGAFGAFANSRYTTLQRKVRLGSVAPAVGPQGGGLVVQGRF
ncbi:MAG: hypothetical protein KUG77_04595 [Nannocystaceae bacterium]|nr:hypothetical protein [Nannocystaceae bacterium]